MIAGQDEIAGNDGTQAIRRAAAMLRRISLMAHDGGPTLSDISESMGLSRSTTHRILKCLVDVGFAAYDGKTRSYEIGPLNYELGLAVSNGVLDLARWREPVDRIAKRTGVTAYLMQRSGIEAVCAHRAEGTSMIRVIPVEVGQRRFLGVGAGATALLAALDDAAVERIISAISPGLGRFANLTPDVIREIVADTRESGFSVSRSRVFSAIFGMGVAVPRVGHTPRFALSIAAHSSEVNERRIGQWKEILMEERAAALNEVTDAI